MLKETCRSTHGLARVVEKVVQPRQPLDQESREEFDARGMTQIETVDLEPLAEGGEIRLLRIPVGPVDRKARGDDDVRTGPPEFEGALQPDLDPPPPDHPILPPDITRP